MRYSDSDQNGEIKMSGITFYTAGGEALQEVKYIMHNVIDE
jgi:hypothetical protein